MAAYKDLVGQKITKVTSNPSEPKTGQMWYNSTDGKLRGLAITSSWISQTPLNTGVYGSSSGGTANAYFVAGGNLSPPLGGVTNKNEQYNGSGFSEEGNLTTARMYSAGTGTVTAGLVTGGDQLPSPRYSVLVEEWNGTSWSEQNDIPQNKNMAAAGPQTAAMIFGGSTPSATSDTRFYDGTDWTSGPALNTARIGLRGGGNQTAAIAMGGDSSAAVEEYNGSSWTSVTSLPANRSYFAGTGPQTNALAAGGYSGSAEMNTTFRYDGTNWTSAPNLGTGRYYTQNGAIGTGSNTWIAGGGGSPLATTTTEEFNSSTNTITAAAWAAGGTMGQVRSVVGGFGTQTAALMCGGNHPGTAQHANAEQYDGTSFSEQSDMGTARSQLGSCGTLTAGLVFGGDVYPTSPRNTGVTEEWDGSSFSEQTDMGTVRRSIGSFGTQTAAVAAAGYVTAAIANVEEYDGSSWTSVTSLPTAFNASGTAGVETAGLVFGGLNPGNPVTAVTVEYDGSNWTSGGSLTTGRWGLNGGPVGTQSDALAFGGRTPSSTYYTNTEGYDGTSWSNRPALASAEYETGKAGTAAAALSAGGNDGSSAKATSEEFTGETTAANIQNFTTS